MNWKQKYAEHFGFKAFEEMNIGYKVIAEKAVELYQKELNEKLKNVGLSISEFSENKKVEDRKDEGEYVGTWGYYPKGYRP